MQRRKWAIFILVIVVSLVYVAGNYYATEDQETVTEAVLGETNGETEALPVQGRWALVSRKDEVNLLGRLVAAEAEAEPYEGKVAVAAVLLNRVKSPSFPNSIQGVIYQPLAFESVSNGRIWRIQNLADANRAAQEALSGWDPTYGALYFWNPYKKVSNWIWSRRIVRQIGKHVFGI